MAAVELAPNGDAPVAQIGSVRFPDLVQAHYAWDRERGDDVLREKYEQELRAFCNSDGAILGVYWCTLKPSAVMLTQGRQTLWQRLVRDHPLRLHRVTNWVMPRSAQKLVAILNSCDELALKAEEILRGTPRRLSMRRAVELEAEVLAFVERTDGTPTEKEIDEFAAAAEKRHTEAVEAYNRAADNTARMVYVEGLLLGVALLPLAGFAAALALGAFNQFDLSSPGVQAFFASMAAGSLGAVVSVLSRMSSPAKFGIDPGIGRRYVRALGSFRPFMGAIFGVALYFLLESSVVQASTSNRFATYVVVAFLGGFSERFLQVMLHQAESAGGPKPMH